MNHLLLTSEHVILHPLDVCRAEFLNLKVESAGVITHYTLVIVVQDLIKSAAFLDHEGAILFSSSLAWAGEAVVYVFRIQIILPIIVWIL